MYWYKANVEIATQAPLDEQQAEEAIYLALKNLGAQYCAACVFEVSG